MEIKLRSTREEFPVILKCAISCVVKLCETEPENHLMNLCSCFNMKKKILDIVMLHSLLLSYFSHFLTDAQTELTLHH